MRKIKMALGIFALTGMIFNLKPISSDAAECGSWQVTSTSNYRCDKTDGCGFLWLSDTAKHDESQYRLCTSISGNTVTVTRETRTVTVKDGCC